VSTLLHGLWPITDAHTRRFGGLAGLVLIITGVLGVGAAYLPWAYGADALDNMTFLGGPSGVQFMGLTLGALTAGSAAGVRVAAGAGSAASAFGRFSWDRAAKATTTGWLVLMVLVISAVALELGGLVNVEYGGWVALVLAVVAWAAARLLPSGPDATLNRTVLPAAVEILIIAGLMAAALFGAAYALEIDDPGTFVVFIVFVIALALTLVRAGVGGFLSRVSERHRAVLVFAAFAVAFAFPFTQHGSNANMSIATQVLIFAATALGLNIVVGLAGLLDLGYIAFLAAGAFTAATLSRSAFATIDWHPPFPIVMLISGLIAAICGLIIGSPTLRVSGDYLAIVTLAFGEIFRITMNNLDGSDGPDLTHGSNGIYAIPDLNLFGFDFGETHLLLGVPIPRFANYYFLLLVVLGVIIVIVRNLNASRIGRGWVAIREDEKAAEAMGVNVFGLKLFAFAGGAFLAGAAGSVKAYVDRSVTPDQYVFLESAFLLAAVVLGGMGTIVGVLVGATLLKLAPEKLRFVAEYRLLIFGALLIVMMRFRPEGLVPSTRRQLEFHADDEQLAQSIEEEAAEEAAPENVGTEDAAVESEPVLEPGPSGKDAR